MMLLTQEPRLRDFWYAVIPMSDLKSGPKPFTLLGEKIVLWLDKKGQPAALIDRCCHRSAQLSRGSVENGCVVCPYHSWAFDASGACVHMPQLERDRAVPKNYTVSAFQCQERYGYAWVSLGEPIADIPHIPEAEDPSYRQINCFNETWNTCSARVVENELDMGHFASVHRGTIGNKEVPLPLTYELIDRGPTSLHLCSEISVRAPDQQRKNIRSEQEVTTREMNVTWFAPFMIRLDLTYPSGLRHIIINHPTPIDDNHIQVLQFHFRDDTEADTSREELISFERRILDEDKFVLESTDPDFPMDKSGEAHMMTDRAGFMFRAKLRELLVARAKPEQRSVEHSQAVLSA